VSLDAIELDVCSEVSMSFRATITSLEAGRDLQSMRIVMIRGWEGVDEARRVDAATTDARGIVQARRRKHATGIPPHRMPYMDSPCPGRD
jgi:hypothetical protein